MRWCYSKALHSSLYLNGPAYTDVPHPREAYLSKWPKFLQHRCAHPCFCPSPARWRLCQHPILVSNVLSCSVCQACTRVSALPWLQCCNLSRRIVKGSIWLQVHAGMTWHISLNHQHREKAQASKRSTQVFLKFTHRQCTNEFLSAWALQIWVFL